MEDILQLKVNRRSFLVGAGSLVLSSVPSSAQSDWRTELGTFRIGILDSEAQKLSPGELERIRAAYADALRMPAEIMRARDLPALVDALVSSRVDYAMLTAAAYSSAYLACNCVEPVANAVMSDGSNGTRTILLLDEKLSLASVTTSKGIAIPGKEAYNTYGAALAGLATSLPAFVPGAKFVHASGSQDAVLADFASGKVDGFLAVVPGNRKAGEELMEPDALGQRLKQAGRAFKTVWVSDPIPNGPHAVRQNLASEAKDLIQAFLVGLARQDPDLNDMLLPEGAVSFGEIAHSNYTFAIRAAKALANSSGQPAP